MELSPEAYQLIAKHVGNRQDLHTLCTVSRGFQRAAERALYNTLHLSEQGDTIALCTLLSRQPRVAGYVRALTIVASDEEGSEEDTQPPTEEYWNAVATALRNIPYTRYLNIHLESSDGESKTWILTGCTFQLVSFHCDLTWDESLVAFLRTQTRLADLFVADFNKNIPENVSLSVLPPDPPSPFPHLTTLECTFTEAASLLVPGRPLTRLKTCFSASRVEDKRAEYTELISRLNLGSAPLLALDIADANYTEAFVMELLTLTVAASPCFNELRYFGTLVLPIGGRERLRFYGMLMHLPHLKCVEFEVSEWQPAPTSRGALRALASELRLYCPSIVCVVFVYDFERYVVRARDGMCVVDQDASTENLWREMWPARYAIALSPWVMNGLI
ncbi:hypothetical protein PUNSTDRAFT_130467 [Punctularia strigosozonata HHB-11173 SS5]|uniref:uncharacterized protein n=1 Tax=Punctularia strigosozonata (strain HHB-11173) TaxID=741275 RepID=UPI00044177F7|nr:uncharacterized protein PUNSTDRAFT_130467 [Punctularia strigosozonata HHB-11173 SS5]EIN12198.1 hypothetical protein PUNSTDRAFT_130467 [Punctularia strigosozonata HHB-11173 SS5]